MALHSFNHTAAIVFGVEEAVLLNNIIFWLKKNQANKKHQHDGRTWTYNSMEAFSNQFRYLSFKQIRRCLDKLVSMGVLVKGNYNKVRYDKTTWYAVENESILDSDYYDFEAWHNERKSLCPNGQTISPNGQLEKPKRAIRKAQTGKPIPDILPNTNTTDIMYSTNVEYRETVGEVMQDFEMNGEPLPTKQPETPTPPRLRATPPKDKAPNQIYTLFEAYAKFCEGKGIPMSRNANGNFEMSGKDAKAISTWVKWAKGMPGAGDPLNDWTVYLDAAWQHGDKFIKANFTPTILQTKSISIVYAVNKHRIAQKELQDAVMQGSGIDDLLNP